MSFKVGWPPQQVSEETLRRLAEGPHSPTCRSENRKRGWYPAECARCDAVTQLDALSVKGLV